MQALVNPPGPGTGSLTELDLSHHVAAMVAREMLHDLRLADFTLEASRDAGFIETDHFGIRFPERGSHFDLTGIVQRWLRVLPYYLADLLRSPSCPRTGGTFDQPSAARPPSWARSWSSTRPAAATTRPS